MLSRILEPEVMDTLEEAHDYDSMDHAEVNRRFAADTLAAVRGDGLLSGDPACHALDLGTGAHNDEMMDKSAAPRRDATTHGRRSGGGDARARQAQRRGRRNDRRDPAGTARRQNAPPYPNQRFTAVVSNSIVHHIPEPRKALAEAVRVTAPGGRLFFRDLLRPGDLEELERLRSGSTRREPTIGSGNSSPSRCTRPFRSTRSAPRSWRNWVSPATSIAATSDRHWTWSAKKSI